MVFEINHKLITPRKLNQSVLQITEMLGMYHAELAHVLHLQCSDIGALAFLKFYQKLYSHFEGDGVAMCNWLRRDHVELTKTPLLVMVDDLRIDNIICLLD